MAHTHGDYHGITPAHTLSWSRSTLSLYLKLPHLAARIVTRRGALRQVDNESPEKND